MTEEGSIRPTLVEAHHVLEATLADSSFNAAADAFVDVAHTTLENGGTLYSCGNGGSMCDAMHFAEEWTGRFRGDRPAQPAIAFSDPARLSCTANDFGYDEIFARDVLPGLSTCRLAIDQGRLPASEPVTPLPTAPAPLGRSPASHPPCGQR